MAVHESFNAGDFMLEDLEDEELESSSVLGSGFCKFLASFDCFTESQLCIPEDSIEDLEWFPSFTDDYISLSGVPATPELETISFSSFPTTPEHKTEDNNRGLSRGCDGWVRPVIPFKKPRSKRVCSRVSSRSPFSSPESQVTGPVMGKRCTHCLAEKTPQWRMGPMGPKTLCNACGVRFKSGRLVPEYRPASSPSFNRTLHSNSHKKIMKMRTVRDG